MALLRKLLFPFAFLYWMITSIRNLLYDWGIFRSHSFEVPVIVVGNLSVGGTGKTPMVEYLIRLLSPEYKVATLSRGYRRKSKGFVLADANATAETLGDEPFQYHSKFPGIKVAVDADRVNGIRNLLELKDKPEILLLDDAYQHRRVRPDFTILLTTYQSLYADDYLLPMGNLRESGNGAKRAVIVVVTKCPPTLDAPMREIIRRKLDLGENQTLFFSYIDYADEVHSQTDTLPVRTAKNARKLLVAGIAKPQPFYDFLKIEGDDVLTFPDHHDFSAKDLEAIRKHAQDRIVVTTEKDYVRLKDKALGVPLYYLPMEAAFVAKAGAFDRQIRHFVASHQGLQRRRFFEQHRN